MAKKKEQPQPQQKQPSRPGQLFTTVRGAKLITWRRLSGGGKTKVRETERVGE